MAGVGVIGLVVSTAFEDSLSSSLLSFCLVVLDVSEEVGFGCADVFSSFSLSPQPARLRHKSKDSNKATALVLIEWLLTASPPFVEINYIFKIPFYAYKFNLVFTL